jgi:hypothetical protein
MARRGDPSEEIPKSTSPEPGDPDDLDEFDDPEEA